MVGLVLVSHSAKLVEGLRDLVEQMEPDIAVAIAGGTDDGGLGTSLELVNEAIEEADSGDGAVILFDLGSAEMTAESALEFMDDDARARLRVVDGPLVEGAIAAAGVAGGDADLDAVAAAVADVFGSPTHSSDDDGSSDEAGSRDVGDDDDQLDEQEDGGDDFDHSVELTLTNESGLHARPAGQISRALRSLDAEVRIERSDTGESANASSTLRLVSLAAPAGTSIIVRARGADAEEAVETITDMVENRFGEPEASE